MMNIISDIRKVLSEKADEKIRKSGERFFKEEVRLYGLRSAEVTGIAREYYNFVKSKGKAEIFELCEELWKPGTLEESFIACNWSYSIHKKYEPSDFGIFDRWVNKYLTNWASCDTLCNHSVGTIIVMYPELIKELKKWALSENRWVRRASAVSLIVPARKGLFADEIFEIAGILHSDQDDMVQKGYGWMLKSASQAHQEKVFDYVMRNKSTMPRTALRYAIEKMPSSLKTKAMAK